MPFTPGRAHPGQADAGGRNGDDDRPSVRRAGCPSAGLVDLAVPDVEVQTKAIELVRPLAEKDPGTLGAIKATMYAEAIVALQTASDVAVP